MSDPIKAIIVDDSPVFRRFLLRGLEGERSIEIVASVGDALAAKASIIEHQPEVVLLDLELPKVHGLTFLRILQERRPSGVVIVTGRGAPHRADLEEACEDPRVRVIFKPGSSEEAKTFLPELARHIRELGSHLRAPGNAVPARPVRSSLSPRRVTFDSRAVIAIGASTGGTEAIPAILRQLPAEMPPIVVIQHIPAHFSRAFAERLDRECAQEVREARQGDQLYPGLILVAPGGYHLELREGAAGPTVRLQQGPPQHFQRPAIDVTFHTVAQIAGAHAVGVLLTGMGKDGAEGMRAMHATGARTIAQDEASCVVYGIPRQAVELGVVDEVLPLDQIAEKLIRWVRLPKKRASAPRPKTLS